MKKYIFFIGMILCLSLSSVSAIEKENPQDIVQTIHQEQCNDDIIVIDIELSEKNISEHSFHQQVTIINETSYDLQLTQLLFCGDIKQTSEKWKIQMNDIDITDCLLQSDETTNQKLQDDIHQQILPSHQQLKITILTENDHMDPKTILQSSIQMEWKPIFLQGYIYKDKNQSVSYDDGDEGFSQMKVNLWQNHNLIQTTLTNEKGYYQFLSYDMTSPSYIEIECPKGYSLVLNQDEHSFTLQNENQLVTQSIVNLSQSENYSIGLIDHLYKVSYYSSKGQLLLEEEHHYLDQIKIKNQTSFQTNEQLIGWSDQKASKDITYQYDEEISMPCYDMKLYAIEKDSPSKQPKEISTFSTKVQTSDETEVSVYLLLLLLCGGYIIIMKSLKKK